MSHLIAEVSEPNGKLLDHFYVLYRWQQGQDKSNEFSQSRHGNATNPFQGDTLWIIFFVFVNSFSIAEVLEARFEPKRVPIILFEPNLD